LGVSVVLAVLFYLGKVVPGTEGTNMEEPVITEVFLKWTYVMAVGAAVVTLLFSIVNLILNPKGLRQAIIGIVGLAVLLVASYFLASDEILNMPGYDGTGNEPGTLKFAGTELYLTYILAGLAVLSIVYSEIAKFFK
jgi:hypothetical protein